MCANDLIAVGVVNAVRAAGLRIPEDVAVVGFDDIETASLLSPRLTTIVNPAERAGSVCVAALIRRLESGAEAPYERIALPTHLVARESA
jgi:LacI family transcriptional regulator